MRRLLQGGSWLRKTAARKWLTYLAVALAVPTVVLGAAGAYFYVSFASRIDARLHGERLRALPRVFARPFELGRGQALTERQLIDRLNDLGYAQRARVESPGEFTAMPGAVSVIPRGGNYRGNVVRVTFERRLAHAPEGNQAAQDPDASRDNRVARLDIPNFGTVERVTLEAPVLTALIRHGREKRRQVALASIPTRMIQAVLAGEARRFYDHPGIDLIRSIAALATNIGGDRPYLVGGSTITQQLVKNLFLTPEKSIRRKLLEQFMALVVERRASKDQILELYLNEVYLGQRGSFAIHGVAEAARLFFGKDVHNVSLSEAALIAGVIQSPHALSPFTAPARARGRRNRVLRAMAEAEFISAEAARRASREPLGVVARALDAEAPYFVDFVEDTLTARYPAWPQSDQGIDVYTTLDLHLQGLAQGAVRAGLTRVDTLLSKPGRSQRVAQAALLAVDPRTGDVLAMVGGRSYNQSQYNRAMSARRQPGSVFKPFVYLAAFERSAAEGRSDLTPATLVDDAPTTFNYGGRTWNPSNYENEYDGPITLRRALALSRNVATVKVAERVGYNQVAALWRRIGAGSPPRPYPSIALGVFEATPYEIATAYTMFLNQGAVRELRSLIRVARGGPNTLDIAPGPAKPVARPDTTFLVTNMMRSVINEGTGAGARAAGLTLDAAGKSGTTNELRDAWFVGFTPELLTVVWVGVDDNQPLGLSGPDAALPIWTDFMIRALAGRPNLPFTAPKNVSFVDVDRDTGALAGPGCPSVLREAFLTGTEPVEVCRRHRF